MKNKDKVIDFLSRHKLSKYCDDCLSTLLKIFPRQQINRICREKIQGSIVREKSTCSKCTKNKIVNKFR